MSVFHEDLIVKYDDSGLECFPCGAQVVGRPIFTMFYNIRMLSTLCNYFELSKKSYNKREYQDLNMFLLSDVKPIIMRGMCV